VLYQWTILLTLENFWQNVKGGFYETKNNVPGRNATGWMLAIEKENSPGEYMTWRPNSGAG
jgi:hypothetical protein